jgi:hypothetical protein
MEMIRHHDPCIEKISLSMSFDQKIGEHLADFRSSPHFSQKNIDRRVLGV